MSGSNVVYANLEPALLNAVLRNVKPRPSCTLTVELVSNEADYEALGKLDGTNTTMMLGDFSHLPQFLFPPGMGLGTLGTYGLGGRMGAPAPK